MSRFVEAVDERGLPMVAAHALRAAFRGQEADRVQPTVDEEVGFIILADMWRAWCSREAPKK